MSVKNKIFIPTLISSANFEPVRTLPHIYFYNGLKECEDYFIQHYATNSTSSVVVNQESAFPYVDYYDGLTPTSSSNSLLFFNEQAVYGTTPTASLYTEYWDTYVELLYNPRTRLFKASAIIPLADYFEIELNDIVQWRGNLYHLRAINDYSLKDGTCKIELLGPIIRDAVKSPPFPIPPSPIEECTFNFSSSFEGFAPTTTTTSTTTAAPTTTTTTEAPTTTTTTTEDPCTECISYRIRKQFQAANSFWQYTNCLNGDIENVSIQSQVNRTMASRTVPVKISGGNTVGPTAVFTFEEGYNCGPFDFCKTETWRIVSKNQTPPGFIQTQFFNPTTCIKNTIQLPLGGTTDITVISGSLTLGTPTFELDSITLLSTGSSDCCNP